MIMYFGYGDLIIMWSLEFSGGANNFRLWRKYSYTWIL